MVLWIPFVAVLAAAVIDLRTREVPDAISLGVLVWALCATALGWHDVGWLGLGAGAIVGFGLGALLFWLGAFGGGDVKLVSAIGALLGPFGLLAMLVYVAIAGALLALVALVRGQREMAYVPAIAMGMLAFLVAKG
ncbi:MAG: prepilin peptidase [Acidobacteria bacterium]|jgi:prepilin peptidase CpaA|nr:prepilin peptidase [Acidobacteriota bacterium]